MKILLLTETLHAGGAETFVVRLANGLAIEHEVTLINIYPNLSRQGLVDQVSTKVNFINLQLPLFILLSKIDSFLYRIKIDFSIIERLIRRKLKVIIVGFKPEVVHTHLFKPDYYISSIRHELNFKFNHVSTNHGDYLLFEKINPVRLLNYDKKLHQTLKSLHTMVIISDDQMKWAVEKKQSRKYRFVLSTILNGYSIDSLIKDRKPEYNPQGSDFIYGMVGRGIKEKGWRNLIHAFNRINIDNKKLVLVGSGPELEKLKGKYVNDSKIIFVGYTSKPIEYIQFFDVAMFTSYAPGESLPTVIIEYLLCNKPIVATSVGAVKQMLKTPNDKIAGLLINYNTEKILEEELENQMTSLYKDEKLRNNLITLSHQAILKFDMQYCIESYLRVYGK